MADFNAIGRPQLATGIGRLFGVDRARVGVMSSEIQLVTSLWERPEFWGLLGGALGAGSFSHASNAGFNSTAQLANPAASGVLLILERVLIHGASAGATTCSFGVSQNLAALTANWANRDLRRVPGPQAFGGMAGQIRGSNTTAVAFGTVYALGIAVPQANTLDFPFDVVIPPGWAFMVQSGVANQQLVGTFIGRERPAPTEELSL